MTSIISILSFAAALCTVTAAPSSKRAASCIPGESYAATFYTVKPSSPSFHTNSTKGPFYVRQDECRANRQNQIILFSSIPADATSCTLAWTQPANGTNFGYYNSGFLQTTNIDLGGKKLKEAVPNGEVSWQAVEPMLGMSAGQADMTFWPERANGGSGSVGGPKDGKCAQEMAFLAEMGKDVGEREALVVMTQRAEPMENTPEQKAGWMLRWKC